MFSTIRLEDQIMIRTFVFHTYTKFNYIQARLSALSRQGASKYAKNPYFMIAQNLIIAFNLDFELL